jgi:arylsulfatase A-like enzyme
MTNAAIRKGRKGFDKMIVHYMQPHEPFIADDAPITGNETNKLNAWDAASANELSDEQLWQSYQANLRYVLEEVGLLLKNIDAKKVVITSDHGNAMGERLGVYGHPLGWLFSEVRNVLWIETVSHDEETYHPPERPQKTDSEIDEQLESLGYL